MHLYGKFILVGCVLGMVLAGGTGCSEARKERRLKAADKHFQAGDYEKAELEYQSARQLAQMDPVAISRLGEIYFIQGRQGPAVSFLQKAVEINPDNNTARLLLARLRFDFGRPGDAYEMARQVLAKEPGNTDALVLLADTAAPAQVPAARQVLEAAPAAAKASSSWHVAAGMLMAKERRLDDALKELNKATEVNPNDHVAHHTLGVLHFMRNNVSAAEESLKRAASVAPLRSSTRLTYIEFLRRTQGEPEAKTVAEELSRQAPDYVPAIAILADMASARDDHAETSKLIDRLLVLDPTNFRAQLAKGTLMIANRDTNAVTYFERFADVWQASTDAARRAPANRTETNATPAKTDPATTAMTAADVKASTLPPILLQKLGESYLLVGNEDRALTYLNEAVARDTNSVEAVTLRDALWLRRGGEDEARAVRSLEQLVYRAPAATKARLQLAEAYARQGRPDLAVAHYQYLAQKNTKSIPYLLLLSEAQAQATNVAASRQTLAKALALDPASPDVHERLSRLDLYEGKTQAALDRLRGQLAKSTNSAPLHYLTALVLLAKGAKTNMLAIEALQQKSLTSSEEFKQAEAELSKAVQVDPAYKPAVIALADIQSSVGRSKEAIDALLAFTAKANDTHALMRLAVLQEGNRDKAGAARSYEKLLALAPENVVVLNNLANIYSGMPDQLNRAADLAKRARDLSPAGSPLVEATSDTLGWIAYRQGDYEGALTHLQRAAQAFPGNAEVQVHFGLASYMAGNENAASNVLSRALKLQTNAPNHEDARAALQVLAMTDASLNAASLPAIQKRLQEVPGDPAALRRMAVIHEKSRDWTKAAEAYHQHARNARLNAIKAASMVKAAEIYAQRLDQPAQALELVKTARPLDPQNPTLAKTMGRLLYEAGDPQWAATLLDEAARRGNDPETLYELAMAYYSMGRTTDSERRLRGVEASDGPVKEHIRQFVEFAEAAKDPGKAAEKVAAAQALLKIEPKHLPALHVLAVAEERAGPGKPAAEAYEKLIAQYPHFRPAAKKAILLNAKLGNEDKALELAGKHKDLATQDSEVSEALGLISFKRGDFQAAARQLQSVQTKDPVTIASLQIARHRARQRVDAVALESAVKAGLPKPLEEQANQVLTSARAGTK